MCPIECPHAPSLLSIIMEQFLKYLSPSRKRERETAVLRKEANPLCGIFQSVSGKIKLSGATHRGIFLPSYFSLYKYKPINTFTAGTLGFHFKVQFSLFLTHKFIYFKMRS